MQHPQADRPPQSIGAVQVPPLLDACGSLPERTIRFGTLFLVLLIVLLVAGRSALLRDPGTFWHTRLGLDAWSTGQFTRHDSFTFTRDGHPWLAVQWLGDMLLAAAFTWGGWDCVLLLAAVSLAGIYTWLACRTMAAGLSGGAAIVLLVLVLGASSHHFHARPHLASIAGMGFTCALLCDVGSRRVPLPRLLLLVPLLTVWTNLHGGALAGLASVALVALGWTLGSWRTMPSVVRALRTTAALLALLALMAGALLVNPFGLDMLRTWIAILQMPLPDMIQEHRPLSLARPEGWMVLLLGVVYFAVLCSIRRGRHHVHDVLPAVWLLLALTRVRHAPLFAITVGVVLADMLPRSRWATRLARHGWLRLPAAGDRAAAARRQPSAAPTARGAPDERSPTLAGALGRRIPLLVVVLAALLHAAPYRLPVIGSGWAQIDPRHWPVDLLPHLDRLAGTSGDAPRVLNALHYGGFLTMYAPRWKTFIDDRCELFGTQFLTCYAHAERHRPRQLDVWARQYDAHVALVPAGSPFDRYLSAAPQWETVTRGRCAVLYQRRSISGPLQPQQHPVSIWPKR